MSILSTIIQQHLPNKKKTTPSGWISFNAPCCINNGHSADSRGRGGLIINEDEGISYHCFNCGFKTGWQPGRSLTNKMRNLLLWLGVPDDQINKTALEIIRSNNGAETNVKKIQLPNFIEKALPTECININSLNLTQLENILPIIQYIKDRNLYLNDIDFYYSTNINLKNRLIIPFYYNNIITGYTARSIKHKNPKYITVSQPGFVFGLDNQNDNWKFCIVCEGPIDAIHIKGTSILGSEVSKQQSLLLNSMDKEIIIVPDRDAAGKKLVDQALENNWSVSMPDWDSQINDVNDCVNKYGRLLTLYSIIQSRESNSLKIKLKAKKWFG